MPPINECNRALISAIEQALAGAGFDLPVYFGNRNWHRWVEDTVAMMTADGVRRAAVFATSAWGGYSGCRQYHENIARARHAIGRTAPELIKLRQFFDHPLFIAACADALRTAHQQADRAARVVFTAHSVPIAQDAAAGLAAEGGHRYSRQVSEAARLSVLTNRGSRPGTQRDAMHSGLLSVVIGRTAPRERSWSTPPGTRGQRPHRLGDCGAPSFAYRGEQRS